MCGSTYWTNALIPEQADLANKLLLGVDDISYTDGASTEGILEYEYAPKSADC